MSYFPSNRISYMWHCHITGPHWFRCCMIDAVFPSKGKIGAGRTWLHEFRWCCPCDEEDLFSVSSDGRRSEGIWWLAQCIHYMNETDCMRMISGDLEVDDAYVFLGRTFWRGSYRGFATRNDEYVRKLTGVVFISVEVGFLMYYTHFATTSHDVQRSIFNSVFPPS